MEVTAEDIIGLAFVLSPIVILIILVMVPESWLRWTFPLIFLVPLALHIICIDVYLFWNRLFGVALAVFLYGFILLLIVFVRALEKPKKVRILGKDQKNA